MHIEDAFTRFGTKPTFMKNNFWVFELLNNPLSSLSEEWTSLLRASSHLKNVLYNFAFWNPSPQSSFTQNVYPHNGSPLLSKSYSFVSTQLIPEEPVLASVQVQGQTSDKAFNRGFKWRICFLPPSVSTVNEAITRIIFKLVGEIFVNNVWKLAT